MEKVRELGPLLRSVTATIRVILKPDQIYICLWSHAGWKPGYLHFVIQPSWNHLKRKYQHPDPFLQVDTFKANVLPSNKKIETFCKKAKGLVGFLDCN